MAQKWIINSKEYFPYSAKDIYLNWWITSRKPTVVQSVVEFLHEPVYYTKRLLNAEKEFLNLAKSIPEQIPKDITKYLRSSIETSKILKEAISKKERIYAIKAPFHIKKWKMRNGKAVWKEILFSDGTKTTLQIIDKNALNIILSIVCTRSILNKRVVDTRFIGSDEIMSLEKRHTVYGIKIHEMKEVLKSFRLSKTPNSSLFLFSAKKEEIKEVVDYFIKQFNTIIKKGLAGLITEEQKPFDLIEGKTINDKIKNIIEKLSARSHPHFPESIFAVACKESLGKAVIETVGIDNGWTKTYYLKKVLDAWSFKALFWTSSNWIQLFYEYTETPKIYHKLFGGEAIDYRGEDVEWAYNYIKNFSKRKKITLIDLGIGTGRELKVLKENKNIKKIIGIDYSGAMLSFCSKIWKSYPIQLNFIQDDFRILINSRDTIKAAKLPKIFTLFFGTINNTIEDDRIKILTAVRKLMTKKDRFIIEFSKLPERQTIKYRHPWLKFKKRKEELGFYETEVYAQMNWFWKAAKEYFGSAPQFFYDDKTHNLVVTITGLGSCFFSHRYTTEEIKILIKKACLKLETLREGQEMYTAIIKK